MIETGNPELSTAIKNTWRKSSAQSEQRYIEYFFRNIYQPEYGFAEIEDNKAVASLCRVPHVIMLNGRALKVSSLCGIAEAQEKNKESRLGHVLQTVIDACEHTELITLAPYDERLKEYGFETAYTKAEYELTREFVKRITNYGCAYDPSALDMLKVYSSYIRRFNGFYAREVADFVRLKKEVAARGGKIVAYYNEKKQIQGYAIFIIQGTEAIVEECVYLNSLVLAKLVNAALQERILVRVQVSEAEDLHIVFPNVPVKIQPAVMMRLNDPELFSRLFGTEVPGNIDEALSISERPMHICGKF